MLPLLFAAALALPLRSPPGPHPRLVVFIAVDQLRGDYLERYQSEWTGGFKRILEEGAFFPHARQDHGVTETAPGHSTFLSGRTPAHTGIVTNTLGVGDPAAPLIGVPGPGASPGRFTGTTLADWLRASDSTTRILSVSRKDRGAILPVGRYRGEVFWYAGGRFTTSRYYADSLPQWIQRFNVRRGPERLTATAWNLLRPASQYKEADSMPYEHGGTDFVFPHALPADSATAAISLVDYPWMDSLTLDLALDGAGAIGLGQGHATDLLAVSLSSTDAIGHDYGPDSRELHDQLLRLDHWLGWFLDSLAQVVPAPQTVFALSSDHGVQSFPEFALRMHHPAGRVSLADIIGALRHEFDTRYQTHFGLLFEGGLLTADVDAMRSRGIDVDSLADALAAAARSRPGVKRILTPALMRVAPPSDEIARLWRRDLPETQGWLIAGALNPGYMWQDSGGWTTHGSLDPQDMSIPIAFWGMGVRPGRSPRTVSSVDIAPTLAALSGVQPTEPLDGHILEEVRLPPSP